MQIKLIILATVALAVTQCAMTKEDIALTIEGMLSGIMKEQNFTGLATCITMAETIEQDI